MDFISVDLRSDLDNGSNFDTSLQSVVSTDETDVSAYMSTNKDGFGIEYGCFLEDSIGKFSYETGYTYVGEYLIVFPILQKICEEYGLVLYEKENFDSFYENHKDKYKDMFDKIMTSPDNYNQDSEQIQKDIYSQWQYACLFMAVSFRKVAKGKTLQDYENINYIPHLKKNGYEIHNFEPELIEKDFI